MSTVKEPIKEHVPKIVTVVLNMGGGEVQVWYDAKDGYWVVKHRDANPRRAVSFQSVFAILSELAWQTALPPGHALYTAKDYSAVIKKMNQWFDQLKAKEVWD